MSSDPRRNDLPLHQIEKRARAIRRADRLRRAAAVAMVGFLLAGATIVVPNLFSRSGESGNAAAKQTSTYVATSSDAVVLTLKALDQAGLLNAAGSAADYQSVEKTTEGWIVEIRLSDCSGSAESGDLCTPDKQSAAQVTVEQRGDELVLTDASGGFSSSEKTALTDHSETAASVSALITEYADVDIEQVENDTLVKTVSYWMGPIGPTPYRALCTVDILDASGNVLWTRAAATFESPIEDAARDSLLLVNANEKVQGAAAARVNCAEWAQ